jgi:flavodoxin
MKATIVYYSKTGNTRKIAEIMAQTLQVAALPLNLAKKGRKTKDELAAEKVAWSRALTEAKEAELVILGTPTQFRKPHPSAVNFVQEAEPVSVAVFCTYYGMLGATLIDMEAILRQHGARFVGGLALRVGTEQYRFRHDVSQYADVVTDTHIALAREFARRFFRPVEPVGLRLRGVCGRDCRECSKYREHKCEGAGMRCWSGRHCRAFDCCILKKSLDECERCTESRSCGLRARPFRTEASQQDSAANGSQPIRSDTNSTSSAAGSHR